MTRCDYGHFTTMQVRGRAVQGLDLHLQRLSDATRELFDCVPDESRVRAAIVEAFDAQRLDDATLRVTIGAPGITGAMQQGDATALAIGVSLQPALTHATEPMRLMPVAHQRTLPHIKHVGIFASYHYRRMALRDGFDDAVFVDRDGCLLEGTFWNVGFWRGEAVVWPDAPALRGTGERLLQAGLREAGLAQSTEVVRLDDLAALDGAFIVNARGVRAVVAVDGHEWPADIEVRMTRLQAVLAAADWQPLQA